MLHKPTIKDIAKAAKASITAVSLALNNRPGVSDKTRERIARIAKRLDYHPNLSAMTLIGKGSKTLALVIESVTDPFYAELAQGAEEKASALGYSILIYNTGGSLDKEKQCITDLRARGVDGLIISTVTMNDPIIRPLLEERFPFVCINRFPLDPSIQDKTDYVALDNYSCGYLGIEHLYRLGHDRIAVIAGTYSAATSSLRLKGSMQAMDDFGIVHNPKSVVECNFLRDKAHEAAIRLIALKEHPTAFFCQDDIMAIGVREAILNSKLKIPEDIALMGMNDIYFASLAGVNLTTIKQNISQMGITGAEILISKIEKKGTEMVNRVIINSELIIRKTCGYHLKGYVR
jgi:LacI family transcriptional regulator